MHFTGMHILSTIQESLPYMVVVEEDDILDTMKTEPYLWCRERFGVEMFYDRNEHDIDRDRDYDFDPSRCWDFFKTQYYFRDEDDATLFKLTFGGR